MLRVLWSYRGFIIGSVKREFQSRYQNSLLGAAWTIINPLAMIVVYTMIFSQVMRAKLPGLESTYSYSIYLCAGVLTWGLFSEITGKAQNIFIDNANLLKKLSFPRLSLPVVVMLNGLLNFAIIFGLFTIFLLITNNFPGVVFWGLLPLLLLQVAFSIGLGVSLGVLNVFFRDVGQFFGVALQFWFWLTPIVYPLTILPENIQRVIMLNPMTGLMSGYQSILVYAQWPKWDELLPLTLLAGGFCFLGLYLFRRNSADMVDEL